MTISLKDLSAYTYYHSAGAIKLPRSTILSFLCSLYNFTIMLTKTMNRIRCRANVDLVVIFRKVETSYQVATLGDHPRTAYNNRVQKSQMRIHSGRPTQMFNYDDFCSNHQPTTTPVFNPACFISTFSLSLFLSPCCSLPSNTIT